MRSARPPTIVGSILLALLVTSARGALVINEVLYDPEGADAGAEWVELLNTGPTAAPLDGVALEAGDGGGPGRWRRFWEGRPGDWIEPGGLWVVGGAFLGRVPDAEATCGLQNGPDGVRLLREAWELDRVGWGSHTWPEYFEGQPAGGVPGGRSLARRLDGADSDQNAADFGAAGPTPGRRNRPTFDLSVSVRWTGQPLPIGPEEPGRPAWLTVRNQGLTAVSKDSFQLFLDGERLSLPDGALEAWLAPGDSVRWPATAFRRSGGELRSWPGWVEFPRDEVPENDADTLRLRAWPTPLMIAEIAPHPDSGATEWVELSTGAAPTDLRGWVLRDAAGTSLILADSIAAQPGEILLLAHDASLLGTAGPGRRLRWQGRWPSLNDRSSGATAADTLWLLGPEGQIADWAAWGNTRAGESWIRASADAPARGLDAWIRVARGEATPGAENRVPQVGLGTSDESIAPAGLALARNPDGVWFRLPANVAARQWRLRAFDLAGQEIWHRSGSPAQASEQWLRWDGRDRSGRVHPGMLILELRQRDLSGVERIEHLPFWMER